MVLSFSLSCMSVRSCVSVCMYKTCRHACFTSHVRVSVSASVCLYEIYPQTLILPVTFDICTRFIIIFRWHQPWSPCDLDIWTIWHGFTLPGTWCFISFINTCCWGFYVLVFVVVVVDFKHYCLRKNCNLTDVLDSNPQVNKWTNK